MTKIIRILYVDDDPTVLDITKQYLEQTEGWLVTTVKSGVEAIRLLFENAFDAIIADYEMEGMSGIDILKMIRSEGNDIPFIIFTGKGREEVAIAAYENGADGYVQKGCDVRSQFAELSHRIHAIIQKRQAEHSLTATRKHLKEVHQLAHIGVWDWEIAGDTITCSDELYRINGWDRTQPAPPYAELSELYTPESWQALQEAVSRALSTGEPYDLILQLVRPDGDLIWTRAFGEPTYNSIGDIIGLRGTVQDITEQKQYEDRINLHATRLESLLNLHQIADSLPETIFGYAIEASLTITSSRYSFIGFIDQQEQMMTIYNWSKEAMTGCEIPQKPIHFPIASAGVWGEAVRKKKPCVINDYASYSSKREYPEEHISITRFLGVPICDGEKIVAVIAVANKPVDYREDDVQALTAFGNEVWRILDRKRTLESLYLKNNAIESSMNGIALADLSGTLTYVNPAFLKIWNYTDEKEVLGKSAVSFWKTPESASEVITVLKEKGTWTGEMEADIIGGKTAVLHVSSHFIQDRAGKPLALMASFIDITDRKQAEIALQKSEERFRQLFNNASDAIFLHELNDDEKPGKFIEVNDAACQNLGYTREELLALDVSDINTPESNALIPEIIPILLDKLHITFECSHQRKNGDAIPVEVATHLFTLDNQKVILSICRDISERKSAEETLSRSERQLKDIIDFLPDATFVIDKTGTIISWNQAIEKMTGILASDMIGKDNYEYALPFYGERRPILIDLAMKYDADISKKYNEFKKVGQHVISESIIANFRGEDVTLWSIATPLYDQFGWLIGSIESIRDVTTRKKTEDALHEAFDTLKTVMDSLEALVYVCDMQTHEILFMNQFGHTVWGDVIGKTCYTALQRDQEGPCTFCTNEKIVDKEGNPTGVYTWEFQNTITKQWYHCRDSAIRWIDGRIVRLEIATDITEQKIAEQALKQANRQLNLLSGITRHDMLNTVNAMQLIVELAKMKIDISPAARDFESLETAISVIQSQIEFTRVYQDLGSHTPQWIDLHQILSSLHFPQTISMINNSVDIEIFADPLISKVFENLLDNSLRHGKNISRITISNKPDQHDMILIYEDDGVGILTKEKDLIFERGFGKNTGFGLFFIREILSITGITISENGQEGIGVRFEIFLPDGVWRYHSDRLP